MKHLLLALLLVGVAFLLLTGTAGCEECASGAERCHGPDLQICDAEGNWSIMMRCDEIVGPDGGMWECCTDTDEKLACLPEGECEE